MLSKNLLRKVLNDEGITRVVVNEKSVEFNTVYAEARFEQSKNDIVESIKKWAKNNGKIITSDDFDKVVDKAEKILVSLEEKNKKQNIEI